MATKIRRCAHGKCRRRPRPEGRYCQLCHAAANRRSHRKHRKERNARRRDRTKNRDEAARARDSARAKLAVALARGKITKGTCIVCQRHDGLIAYIADPRRWSEVVWACREHRLEVTTLPSTGIEPSKNTAEKWARQREAAFVAVDSLPEEDRECLYEIAGRGPAGVRLSPEAPLFAIQLVRAYQIHSKLAKPEPNGGW